MDQSTLMLHATSCALWGRDCGKHCAPAGRRASTGWNGWPHAETQDEPSAAPDAEETARWIVARYPDRRYQALVVGASHGAASHLAVALGVPWLPAPAGLGSKAATGSAAGERREADEAREGPAAATGSAAGERHEAGLWAGRPAAYAEFCRSHLEAAAPVLVLGGPAPSTQDAIPPAHESGPVHQIRYGHASDLSAAVADLYRRWLREAGKAGNRLFVECGALMDPYQVLRAGLVPYWLPDPRQQSLTALELWLAASEPFTDIELLVEPPGINVPGLATLDQCASAAAFGLERGVVDRKAARAYPSRRLAAGYATRLLRQHPYDLPRASPLPVESALAWLGASPSVSLR